MPSLANRFIEALHRLEQTGDPEDLANLFAEEATVSNPLVSHEGRGRDAALDFWRSYRGTFKEIKSEFRHVVEKDDLIVLEWVSEGATDKGNFRYGGVSIIESQSGKVTTFRSYFDPRHVQGDRQSHKKVEHGEASEMTQREAAERRAQGGYQ